MRSKISTPEVQPCSSVAVVLHLSRWKQILVVYQSYARMSSWQPDVKLIQATLSTPEGRGCFCTAAHNYAEKAHQKHYCWMHLNGIIQVNLLSLSRSRSFPASMWNRRMTLHYWLMRCYVSIWSYVTVLLQGFSSTAHYSLRYFRELHWINYLTVELWYFLGLYDRWQTHLPSVSLSSFSPSTSADTKFIICYKKRQKKIDLWSETF